MFVAALALFSFATPSAKAQTYIVTITGGSAGGCSMAGSMGTLTISGDTLEFTSTSHCYFRTVGYDIRTHQRALTQHEVRVVRL